MTDTSAELQQLETRLRRGWDLIERAEEESNDRDVARYTRLWLQLLSDYERLAAPPEPQEHEPPP